MADATITYLQLTKDATDLSTYTFSSVNFSTASADRRIIVAISGRTQDGTSSGNVITSVTIGGVAASIVTQGQNSGNTNGIAIALVPTGTSGDVVVVFAETMTNADIATYHTTGVSSNIAFSTGTSTADPLTANINVPAGGIAVALAKSDNGGATATWAGLTERYDEQDVTGNDISGASDAFATVQTGLTVSCQWTGSTRPVYAVASFAPSDRISFGNTGSDVDQGSGTTSYNNNGDFLMVNVNSTTDDISAMTYNGVAMTQLGTSYYTTWSTRYHSTWYLVNPAQGSNNVVATGGANWQFVMFSASGVDQTTPTSGLVLGADTDPGTNPTLEVTTTVDNAYAIAVGQIESAATAGVNTTRLLDGGSANYIFRSTDEVSPAGAFTLNITAASGGFRLRGFGLNPDVVSNIKTYNTNLQANIKTINTNPIANVKTLDTNTNT